MASNKVLIAVCICFFNVYSIASVKTGCSKKVIQSPSYGSSNTYPPNLNCSWLLTSKDSNTLIIFTVKNLQLEECSRCSCDYLEIFDGRKNLGRYCKGDIRLFSTGRQMLILFQTDGRSSAKGFIASYKNVSKTDVCLNTKSTSSLTIRYPTYGNIICNWLLDAAPPSKIALEMSKLSFQSTCATDCSCGRVEIYDGSSSSNLKLGTWCTLSEVPSYLLSSASFLFVKFTVAPHILNHEFKATYKMVKENKVCSNSPPSQDSYGTLKSYDYKSKYIASDIVYCSWPITVDHNYFIRVTVRTLDFDGCKSCGHLQIFDGATTSSTKLGEWTKEKPDLVSSGNHMLIIFKTTRFAETNGLEATYERISMYNICPPEPAENQGEIETYGFPKDYPGNMYCSWKLKAQVNHVIRLTIDSIYFPNCATPQQAKDYVDIYDGDSEFANNVVEKLSQCSPVRHIDIVSRTNRLLVVFTSKSSRGSKGFRGTYTSISKNKVCPGSGLLRASTIVEQLITSPLYPHYYLGNMKCFWLIQTEPGSVIRFTVQKIDFQDCKNCACDYIEIYDGSSEESTSSGKWCKNTAELLSSGQSMYIVLRTDTFWAYSGFKANFKAIPETEVCPGSGKRVDGSGSIQSPRFPIHYEGGLSCEWTITANLGYKLHLTAEKFNLQDCPRCRCDKVAIFDGDSSKHRALGIWCTSSFDVISTGQNLHVVFSSNFDPIGGGFHAAYVTISEKEVCPMTISKETETAGTISTFNYPNQYPGNLKCTWDVRGLSEDNVIRLSFISGAQFNCNKDVLQVYDSSPLSSELIPFTPWCSENIPEFIFSSGSKLLVKFQADSKSNQKGFMASFRFIKKNAACEGTGTLTENNGKLKGPDFQYGEHQTFFCQWLIKAPEKHDIRLSLKYKSSLVSSGSTCSKHFVEIFNGSFPTNRSLGRFCNDVSSRTIIIRGSSTYVMLWIDSDLDAKERPSFSADYKFLLNSNEGEQNNSGPNDGFIIAIVVVALFFVTICLFLYIKYRETIYDRVRKICICG